MRDALNEQELVERARAGDADAYAELVRTYQSVAFRTAFLITRTAEEAEEAAQDGFVKAWRALGRFRKGSPFRPWLLRIVTNEALNRHRSRRRRDALAVRATAEAVAAAPGAEGEALSKIEAERLLAAVDRLPQPQRLVITYLYLLGLSEEETATVLRTRRGTVKSRASRARAALAADLGEEL